MTGGMSTTRTDDALDSWLADLTGGETSMRRLRRRLTAEGTGTADACPTCHRAADDHTANWVAEPLG